MDYLFILAVLLGISSRITCVPLLNEMMGSDPSPKSPKQKSIKFPAPSASSTVKPAPKPSDQKTFSSSSKSMMTNVEPSQQTTDPGLSMLDNPLLGQQLDALLTSKPYNLMSSFNNFQNPAFEAQLNKMFNSLPLGSLTSMSFLNNPLMGTQPNPLQGTNLASQLNSNLPAVSPQMKIQGNLLSTKTSKPTNQEKLPNQLASFPTFPSFLNPNAASPSVPKKTSALLMDSGIGDMSAKPVAKTNAFLGKVGPLTGKFENLARLDKTLAPTLRNPADQTSLLSGLIDITRGPKFGTFQDLKGQKGSVPEFTPGPDKTFAQSSKLTSFIASQDPLTALMPEMSIAAQNQVVKSPTPLDEIGKTIIEMNKLVNPQSLLGGTAGGLAQAQKPQASLTEMGKTMNDITQVVNSPSLLGEATAVQAQAGKMRNTINEMGTMLKEMTMNASPQISLAGNVGMQMQNQVLKSQSPLNEMGLVLNEMSGNAKPQIPQVETTGTGGQTQAIKPQVPFNEMGLSFSEMTQTGNHPSSLDAATSAQSQVEKMQNTINEMGTMLNKMTMNASPQISLAGTFGMQNQVLRSQSPLNDMGSVLNEMGGMAKPQIPQIETTGTGGQTQTIKPQAPFNEMGLSLSEMTQIGNPQIPLESAIRAPSQVVKQQTPVNELGRTLNGMTQMMNPQKPMSADSGSQTQSLKPQTSTTDMQSVLNEMAQMVDTQNPFGGTKGAPTQGLKPRGPMNEIGSVLNEMSQMVNSPTPTGGVDMRWDGSPVATSLTTGDGRMLEGNAPVGMTWLNGGGGGLNQKKETFGASWTPTGSTGSTSLPGQINTAWPKADGVQTKTKYSFDTSWLKQDLGALVGEAGRSFTDKKKKPTVTVCKLKDLYAICNLVGNPSRPEFKNITGTLYLRQQKKKSCKYDWLNIQVDISNVPMNDGTLFHGMHIHQYGEMTNGCEGMGPHYNPSDTPHGAPWQPERLRHIGDLGNMRQRRRDGKIYTRIVDYVAQLHGPESIIGRGIALKTGRDDLGQGNTDTSKTTGNSGDILACCVISRSRPHTDDLYSLY